MDHQKTKPCPMQCQNGRLPAKNEYYPLAQDEQYVTCWTCGGAGVVPDRR